MSYIANNEPVLLWTGRAMLDGRASIPAHADGIVIIAGLGGTFHHERLRGLAARLNDEGFGALIADVLTPDEQQFDARTGHFRVDTGFLAERIAGLIQWVRKDELTRNLPVGIFGTSDVAAASIVAAEKTPLFALALVDPRIDHVRAKLSSIDIPTLLLIDHVQSQLPPAVHAESVPGVASLLDDDDVADAVAGHTTEWFRQYVPALVA
jgi:putative phosphoribosyl transferase